MKRCQRWSNLTSLHNFVELRFSHARRCPRYTVQFPICATNFMFFLNIADSENLATEIEILSTCSCLWNRVAALGFQRYHAALFNGTKSDVWSPSRPNVMLFPQSLICLGRRSVSCCILHSSELDSFLRLTPFCLVVSFVKCSMSWCSQRASRLVDAEVCVSQVKFSVKQLSRLVCPNSKHMPQ